MKGIEHKLVLDDDEDYCELSLRLDISSILKSEARLKFLSYISYNSVLKQNQMFLKSKMCADWKAQV